MQSTSGIITHARLQDYKARRAQGVPNSDPDMILMHQTLSQVQQRTELLKQMQQTQLPRLGPHMVTSTTVSTTGNSEGHKRKHGPGQDAENIPPAKRMALSNVVDFSRSNAPTPNVSSATH